MNKFIHLFDYLTTLTGKGYKYTFELTDKGILVAENGLILSPDNFVIKEYFHLDGVKDPKDVSLIYAIESNDGKIKGALITTYTTFNNFLSTEMMKKLALHPHPVNYN